MSRKAPTRLRRWLVGVALAAVPACQSPSDSPPAAAPALPTHAPASARAPLTTTSAFAADHDWRFYRHAGSLADLETFLGGIAAAKTLVPAPKAHTATKRVLADGTQLQYPPTLTTPTTSGAQLKQKLTACGYPALAAADVAGMAARMGVTVSGSTIAGFVDSVYVMREPDHAAYCVTTVKGDTVRTAAFAPLQIDATASDLAISAAVPHTDCAGFVNLVATTAGCP